MTEKRHEINTKKLEEASTPMSAKTYAGPVFVPRDLDLWPFDPKINTFPGLMVQHFTVKFDDPSFSVF